MEHLIRWKQNEKDGKPEVSYFLTNVYLDLKFKNENS